MAKSPKSSKHTSTDAMIRPRFTEISTFMRAPLAASFDDLDIALIGVPMDLGVTNRAGARHGPREIRNASSLMRMFNVSTRVAPYELANIADVGDVPIDHLFNLDEAIQHNFSPAPMIVAPTTAGPAEAVICKGMRIEPQILRL